MDAMDKNDPRRFKVLDMRFRPAAGAVEFRIGDGKWQKLLCKESLRNGIWPMLYADRGSIFLRDKSRSAFDRRKRAKHWSSIAPMEAARDTRKLFKKRPTVAGMELELRKWREYEEAFNKLIEKEGIEPHPANMALVYHATDMRGAVETLLGKMIEAAQ